MKSCDPEGILMKLLVLKILSEGSCTPPCSAVARRKTLTGLWQELSLLNPHFLFHFTRVQEQLQK